MTQKLTRQKKILCFAVYSVYFLPLKNTKEMKPTHAYLKRNSVSILCQAMEVSYSQQK